MPWKDRKEVAKDLKSIYQAVSIEEAERKLKEFEEKWNLKYPHIGRCWRANWEELMTYFKYSVEIRKLLYTTNIMESVKQQVKESDTREEGIPVGRVPA